MRALPSTCWLDPFWARTCAPLHRRWCGVNARDYLPGHAAASAMMARRRADRDAAFFARHLRPGLRVLDCGCGPGTIAIGLAELIAPGSVIGVDISELEVGRARAGAQRLGVVNAEFVVADVTALKFADASFDAILFHGVLCHLKDPSRALAEALRVARPGALIGAREPDMRGDLYHPPDGPVARMASAYQRARARGPGDPTIGSQLRGLFAAAGLRDVEAAASYECYADAQRLAEHFLPVVRESARRGALTGVLHPDIDPVAATSSWTAAPDSFFARSWGEAIGFANS